MTLSLGIFFLVRQWDRERVEREFEWRLRREAQALEVTLRGYEECLYSLRNLYDASAKVTFAEFQTAARDLRARHPGIELLQWVERVPHDRRETFETWAREAVEPSFAISSAAGKREDGTIERSIREPTPEYVVTTYIDPLGPHAVALGFDMNCGQHAGLIPQAVETGELRASHRVRFREETGRAYGWVVFLPVYAPGAARNTPEARRTAWRGCVEGAFRLDDLFSEHRTASLDTGLDLLLLDETAGTSDPFLLRSREGLSQTSSDKAGRLDSFRTGLTASIPLAVQGRNWRLWGRPTPAWQAAQQTSFPFAFLGGGMLLTGLLTSILRNAQGRRAAVERLVTKRTAALRASEDRYRAFVEQSTEAIWRFEMEPPIAIDLPVEEQIEAFFTRSRLAECNDVMAQMYGFPRSKEFVGTMLSEFMPRTDPRNVAHLRAYVENRYRLTDEETFEIDREGRTKYFLNNLTGIVKDGFLLRTWGTQRDITERRRAEAERTAIERKLQETQKLESLGVLAGGIAHDFNNLLTGVLGNASLARMELPPDSPVQESLGQIELTAQRAAELCKQMLAYSGKGRFVVQQLDLSAVVRDTTELVQLSISKNAVLKFALGDSLPAITADATQLRQIIMNLVINASEAMGEKGGLISLSTGVLHADRAYLTETHLSPDLPEGRYVFLEVSDNGAGMSAETKARIFDPFFTTKFTGRGLGLAAVLGIVRGHKGALKVYSEEGRGTTFKLLLPAVAGPADHTPIGHASTPAWRGHGTVLVIDDEETVRTIAARMLTALGFEPLLAHHGRAGLDLYASHPGEIAAVLLDLTMPVLDGAATLTELRRLRPDLPILLMSGFTEHDALDRFAGKGLAGFLQKPFKTEDLRAALRAMFESRAGA